MRPKMMREELPTCTTVRTNIKNEYARYMEAIHECIFAALGNVSVNWDLWTEEHASLAYFGMIAQWIDTNSDSWCLRSEVIAFHKISGNHSGKNLGRYFIKFTDCASITSKRKAMANKVSTYSMSIETAHQMCRILARPCYRRQHFKQQHDRAGTGVSAAQAQRR